MRNWNKIGAAVLALALLMPAGFVMAGGAEPHEKDDKDHQIGIFISDGDDGGHANVQVIRDGENIEWTSQSDRPFLGVVLTYKDKNGESGAGLMQIVPDSPAARAGLEKGDVIVVLGGTNIENPGDITEALNAHSVGESVAVVVDRDGSQQSFTVTLGEQQSANVFALRGLEGLEGLEALEGLEERLQGLEGLIELKALQGMEGLEGLEGLEQLQGLEGLEALEGLKEGNWFVCEDGEDCDEMNIQIPRMMLRTVNRRPMLGVALTETTPDLRVHLGGEKDRGILVSKVLEGTLAEEAGIEVGDLITAVEGNAIRHTGDLIKALHDGADSTVEIEFVRDGRESSVRVDLPGKDEEVRPDA